jgi:hypothetical protein
VGVRTSNSENFEDLHHRLQNAIMNLRIVAVKLSRKSAGTLWVAWPELSLGVRRGTNENAELPHKIEDTWRF